jgi:hypothetical protein
MRSQWRRIRLVRATGGAWSSREKTCTRSSLCAHLSTIKHDWVARGNSRHATHPWKVITGLLSKKNKKKKNRTGTIYQGFSKSSQKVLCITVKNGRTSMYTWERSGEQMRTRQAAPEASCIPCRLPSMCAWIDIREHFCHGLICNACAPMPPISAPEQPCCTGWVL